MYSRSFGGGIESDGTLHEMESRYGADRSAEAAPLPQPPAQRKGGGIKRLLSGLDTGDLLLLAIGALVLLDGEPDNDVLVALIAFLLLF